MYGYGYGYGYYEDAGGPLATMADAHAEWHANTGVPMAVTYLLYGKADRGDLVAMFFAKRKHAREFTGSLPGQYHLMKINGVDYGALRIGKITSTDR